MAKPSSLRSRVAANVRACRRARGLSQEALGDLAGVHRTFVGHVERGETNVSIDTLERLAEALQVPVVAFFAEPET